MASCIAQTLRVALPYSLDPSNPDHRARIEQHVETLSAQPGQWHVQSYDPVGHVVTIYRDTAPPRPGRRIRRRVPPVRRARRLRTPAPVG